MAGCSNCSGSISERKADYRQYKRVWQATMESHVPKSAESFAVSKASRMVQNGLARRCSGKRQQQEHLERGPDSRGRAPAQHSQVGSVYALQPAGHICIGMQWVAGHFEITGCPLQGFAAGCSNGSLSIFEREADNRLFKRVWQATVEGLQPSITSMILTSTEEALFFTTAGHQMLKRKLTGSQQVD